VHGVLERNIFAFQKKEEAFASRPNYWAEMDRKKTEDGK
jgi:hypothetical protein